MFLQNFDLEAGIDKNREIHVKFRIDFLIRVE
jgi:hypothetical protein